jgi:hypothetical protein
MVQSRFAVVSLVALALGSGAHAASLGGRARTYISARYHYSLTVPTGFRLAPAKADQLFGFFPAAPSAEVDFYNRGPANDEKGIAVASVALPAGTSLKGWVGTNLQAIAHQFNCHAPKRRTITLDGTPAVELDYASSCYGDFETIEAVHAGRGYDVYWLGPVATRAEDQARFHADLRAFHFTP